MDRAEFFVLAAPADLSLFSSVDIPFSEGPVNLNWAAIMKTVNEDPHDFFKEGGWSFLNAQEDVGSLASLRVMTALTVTVPICLGRRLERVRGRIRIRGRQ